MCDKPPSQNLAHQTSDTKLDAPQWDMADIEGATLQLWQMITEMGIMHTGKEKRQGLLQLVRWWSASHPSERCQAASQKLVAFYSTLWPESEDVAPEKFRAYKVGVYTLLWALVLLDQGIARVFVQCAAASGPRKLWLVTFWHMAP